MWFIIFNWYGLALVGGVCGGSLVALILLAYLGVDADLAVAPVLLVAGILLQVLDIRRRRRNEPLSPVWRLFYPRAGGHIFFVPCWAMGSGLIFIAWVAFVDLLKSSWLPNTPDAAIAVGLLGFLIPLCCEYFAPSGLSRTPPPKADFAEPIEPE